MKYFDSRIDAKIWMIRNQFARRNLIPGNRCELALVLEPMIQEKAKENKKLAISEARKQNPKTEEFLFPQNSAKTEIEPIETRKELGKLAGVSHDTVMKYKKIKEKAPDEVIQQVRSGDISVNQAYTTINRQEKNPFLKVKVCSSIYGLISAPGFHYLRWAVCFACGLLF